MVFRLIDKALSSWWKDVFRLHDTLCGRRPSSEAKPPEPAPMVNTPAPKPPKIWPFILLDRFCLVANVGPEDIIHEQIRLMEQYSRGIEFGYTARTFEDPIEALESLAPLVRGFPGKLLFFRGRNDAYCIVTNSCFAGGPNVIWSAERDGFDALSANYRAERWDYYVEMYTVAGLRRRLVSSADGGGGVNWADWPEHFDFEDPEAIKRLKMGKPIGRGEIAKFCELFGWPLPVSREGLEFVTEAVMYEISPAVGEPVSEEEQRVVTIIPPGWLGEEVDLLATPAEDPVIAKREAARRKWTKFRRAFSTELKERLGEVRCVLVLPRDGVERLDDCIDVIAPDDGTLLKGFEERAVTDAVLLGSFFVEAEVIGIDKHRDVYVTLEMSDKPEGEKADWRIGYAPGAETPIPAYEGEGEHRALMDVKDTYAG